MHTLNCSREMHAYVLLRSNNHLSFQLLLMGILATKLIAADMAFKIYLLKKLPAQRTFNPCNVTNQILTPIHGQRPQ